MKYPNVRDISATYSVMVLPWLWHTVQTNKKWVNQTVTLVSVPFGLEISPSKIKLQTNHQNG